MPQAASSEPPPILLDPTDEDDIIKHKCPFERVARNLCCSADVKMQERSIDDVWIQIVTKGQINMFDMTEHGMDKAQVLMAPPHLSLLCFMSIHVCSHMGETELERHVHNENPLLQYVLVEEK